ncbi:hypothetical protein ACWEPC_51270 [Nonomuraea sp. NPDC004297]
MSAESLQERKRRKARDAIVTAAYELFGERGFDAVTMAEHPWRQLQRIIRTGLGPCRPLPCCVTCRRGPGKADIIGDSAAGDLLARTGMDRPGHAPRPERVAQGIGLRRV